MSQKFYSIDVYNNASIIYMRKASSIIISWISILIIGSILLGSIMFFLRYDDYNVYYANVVNTEDGNYISFSADESFIELKNRNYMELSGQKCKCHLLDMTDNYYIYNGIKYWNVMYDCEMPNEINVNNNVIEVRIDKGIKNGRVKN